MFQFSKWELSIVGILAIAVNTWFAIGIAGAWYVNGPDSANEVMGWTFLVYFPVSVVLNGVFLRKIYIQKHPLRSSEKIIFTLDVLILAVVVGLYWCVTSLN